MCKRFNVAHICDPREGPANGAALDRQLPTFRLGVQPSTPAGHTALNIHQRLGFTGAVGASHQPYKLQPCPRFPAPNTCPHSFIGIGGFALRCHCFLRQLCCAFGYFGCQDSFRPGSSYSNARPTTDLNRVGVGHNVNAPAGEFGGQPRVLPFLADGQRQLIIRDNHPSRTSSLVDNGD